MKPSGRLFVALAIAAPLACSKSSESTPTATKDPIAAPIANSSAVPVVSTSGSTAASVLSGMPSASAAPSAGILAPKLSIAVSTVDWKRHHSKFGVSFMYPPSVFTAKEDAHGVHLESKFSVKQSPHGSGPPEKTVARAVASVA